MPIVKQPGSRHPWPITRTGSLDQVRLLGAAELRALSELDNKWWVALACPIRGLDLDERTLALIDGDGDGRIRVPEVLAAVSWACEHLHDPGLLLRSGDRLPLAAINDGHPSGQRLLRSSRRIIADLKLKHDDLGPDDTGDLLRILSLARFNGDGVITAQGVDQPAQAQVIEEIIACYGGVADRSGPLGVDAAAVDRFANDLTAFEAWWRGAEEGADTARLLLPLAAETPLAVNALQAVRSKIDDFFARCRLLRYDANAAPLISGAAEWSRWAGMDLSVMPPEVFALPLQAPQREGVLRLSEPVNPAWQGAVAKFIKHTVNRLLPAVDSLNEQQWQDMQDQLQAYIEWAAAKPAAAVEGLGIERIRSILAADWLDQIRSLIAADAAVSDEIDGIADVDRLVRYRRDLRRLLHNFVNFEEFYRLDRHALFQAGHLYIDQRRCDLVLQVDDPERHQPFAALSRCCTIYCRCSRQGQAPIFIAAVLTRGDLSQMMVGRAGIFYDRRGHDWDAQVLRISEAPISIGQAFWTPWRKIAHFIETQAENLAAAKQQAVDRALHRGVQDVAADASVAPASVEQGRAPFDIARFVGIFAAIGLAIGAIGGAVGGMLATFARLAWWQIPLALLGIMMVISGPSMILAWLKLRNRTLGPLLEGCGWAINGRIHLTRPLGQRLTQRKRLLPGSTRQGSDPYGAVAWYRRWWLLAIVVLLAGVAGWYATADCPWWSPEPIDDGGPPEQMP